MVHSHRMSLLLKAIKVQLTNSSQQQAGLQCETTIPNLAAPHMGLDISMTISQSNTASNFWVVLAGSRIATSERGESARSHYNIPETSLSLCFPLFLSASWVPHDQSSVVALVVYLSHCYYQWHISNLRYCKKRSVYIFAWQGVFEVH